MFCVMTEVKESGLSHCLDYQELQATCGLDCKGRTSFGFWRFFDKKQVFLHDTHLKPYPSKCYWYAPHFGFINLFGRFCFIVIRSEICKVE